MPVSQIKRHPSKLIGMRLILPAIIQIGVFDAQVAASSPLGLVCVATSSMFAAASSSFSLKCREKKLNSARAKATATHAEDPIPRAIGTMLLSVASSPFW